MVLSILVGISLPKCGYPMTKGNMSITHEMEEPPQQVTLCNKSEQGPHAMALLVAYLWLSPPRSGQTAFTKNGQPTFLLTSQGGRELGTGKQ